MQKFLTLTLPLLQDKDSQSHLNFLREKVFTSQQFIDKIDAALKESEAVHFAKFVIIDDKYIQINTIFDGDPLDDEDRDYAIFFFRKLEEVYREVYKIAVNGPANDQFNMHNYLSYNSAHRLKPFYTYSAYPDKKVTDILSDTPQAVSPPTAGVPTRPTLEPIAPSPDLKNVQGIIVRSYKSHPVSRHLLLEVTDAQKGREFLRKLTPYVTSAEQSKNEGKGPYLNLGITYNGLKALKVDGKTLKGEEFANTFSRKPFNRNGFPEEFAQSGGKDLGVRGGAAFMGTSAPENWWKDGNASFESSQIHVLLNLYAVDKENLEDFAKTIRALLPREIRELHPVRGGKALDSQLYLERDQDKVMSFDHFGFRDGISQPKINWPQMDVDKNDPNFRDFREFLLGYATTDAFQSAPSGDFVKDGSYLVFQVIHQDVAAFHAAVQQAASHPGIPAEVREKEEWIAAKMVGRWRSGTPLVKAPFNDTERTGNPDDDFGYSGDPDGARCPFSSHIRVTNPRDQEIHPMSGPVPRLIRRGRPYGPEFKQNENGNEDRGLVGMFICASIGEQYLKLAKWINQNNFSPVFSSGRPAQDPIMGNRDPKLASGDFQIPIPHQKGITLPSLGAFTETRGAVFCLLPSLRTIEALGNGEFME
jgi:Dyp-type peroxidase family